VTAPAVKPPSRRIVRAEGVEARVSPLELFFDLVFVFALTQVTAFMADDPTFAGLGRGLMILAILWWAWGGYAWLTSTVDPELGTTRVVMFLAMGAFLVVALATPGAFGGDGVLWGVAYLAVRMLHVALFALAARGDAALRRQVFSLFLSALPGAGLIVLASAAVDGTARDALWLAALVLDYGIVLAFGVEGWHVHAEHFAERFGLVVIIALGESIVAIGVGAEDLGTSAEEIVAAGVALSVVCMLWWSYFDVYALVAERRFREAVGVEQLRIARDSYALLHYLMIAGIVLFALGAKKLLEHPGDPLKDMPAVALCGGLALFALGMTAFRLRNTRTLARPRLVAAVACLALIPVAMEAAALVALAVLAAVWVALVAYETLRFREYRARVRAQHAG
jgi:low temperature requirement protein LtrA